MDLVYFMHFYSDRLSSTFGIEKFLKPLKVLVRDLGLHRAVLGPAHRAELRLLVDVRRQSFVVILLGPLGIQG